MRIKSFLLTSLFLLTFTTFTNQKNVVKTTAETTFSDYAVTNYLYVGDEVIFSSLGCSTSSITEGYELTRQTGTVKAKHFEGREISASDVFKVEQGYKPGTFAFKLNNSYLRRKGDSLIFKTKDPIDAYFNNDTNSYEGKYYTTIKGQNFGLSININESDGKYYGSSFDYFTNDYTGSYICGTFSFIDGSYEFVVDFYDKDNNYQPETVALLTGTYEIEGGAFLLYDDAPIEDNVDAASSWTYVYDKNLQQSFITSCDKNDNAQITFKDDKFKLVSNPSYGIDLFIKTSINKDKHTPINITLDTTNVDLTPNQNATGWNWTSLIVNSSYSGGISSNIPLGGYDISMPDLTISGEQIITVRVYDLTKSFAINVKEAVVPDPVLSPTLRIDETTFKTHYYVGEEIDHTGDVYAQYTENNGNVYEVKLNDSDLTWDDRFGTLSPTNSNGRSIQAQYKINGRIKATGELKIYVSEKPWVLEKITAEVKQNYFFYDSEKFNSFYVSIVAHYTYTDETKTKILKPEDGVIFEGVGFDINSLLPVGDQRILITYSENEITKSCYLDINVRHKPVHTGYIMTCDQGYVGQPYPKEKIHIFETFDVGEPKEITTFNITLQSSHNLSNTTMPGTYEVSVELADKTILTESVELVFAPVKSFQLRYVSSKDDAKIGDTQQLQIKKVNDESTIDLTDTERQMANLARFTFHSSNDQVATVDECGLITYVGYGACEIVVSAKNDANINQIFKVEGILGDADVESISLNIKELNIKKGEETQLIATVSPSNAKSFDVIFSSSDVSVAFVAPNGTIRAFKKGTTVIRAASAINENIYAECIVNVYTEPELESISVIYNGGNIALNGSLDKNNLVVIAHYTEGKSDEIISSEEYEVSLDTSKVNDAAVATVMYQNKTATFTVSVYDPNIPILLNIEVEGAPITFKIGDSLDLSNLIIYGNYSDGKRLDVTNRARIDATGVDLTKAGVYKIKVKFLNKETSFSVEVVKAKTGCAGSLISSCGILSILTLSGALLLIKKRKDK